MHDQHNDLSFVEIYDEIDRDDNLLVSEDNQLQIGAGYGKPLLGIERFVTKAISSAAPAFSIGKNRLKQSVMVPSNLAQECLSNFNSFIDAYDEDYEYSEHVNLFYTICSAMHLDHGVFQGKGSRRNISSAEMPKVLNEFFESIKSESRKKQFKKKLQSREYNSRRNYRSCEKYIGELYQKYSRLLIIRLDLGYKQPMAGDITAEVAHRHRERILNNVRSNKIFNALVGYIWKLEYGESKGCHFHFMLFYDGSKAHKDAYLAYQIGKYWVNEITKGNGTYYNCNLSKANYKKCGIGMISHFEAEKRRNLLFAVRYLTKKDQYLRMRTKERVRVFGKGEVPRKRLTGAGRPRVG